VDRRFGREHRLRKRREFLAVYARGAKLQSRHFFVYVSPNGREASRLGITVSRKVGDPVIRNRIKRRFREIFRAHKDAFPIPADVVVNPRRSAAQVEYSVLESDFLKTVTAWKPQ
jgi:ribonuclease P protein component